MAGPKAGAVELTARRTARAKHYRNPDRSFSAVVSTGPIHYRATPGGPWLDKDLTFSAGGTRFNEQRSLQSDVSMATWQTGSGGARRWWVEFIETLSGKGIQFQLSFQPTPVPGTNELQFTGTDGVWSYFHTRTGGKMLGPPIAAAQGARTYGPFPYVLVGGADQLVPNPNGSLQSGSVFYLPAPHVNGADGVRYAQTSWTLDAVNQTVSFAIDDTGLPASAFPYRVDPSTTFSIAGGADDKQVFVAGATYPPSGTPTTQASDAAFPCQRSFVAPNYHVNCALAKWDTSSIPPGAVVLAATSRMRIEGAPSADGRNVVAEWRVMDGTSADWSATPANDAHAGTPIANLVAGSDFDFELRNLSGVSTGGDTGLRFHVDGGQPTGSNYAQFYAFEDATNPEPKLLVDYQPGEPLAPDAMLAQSGLTGALSAIQDDPDAPDANWLTAQDPSAFANQYAAAQDGVTPGGFAGQLTSPDNAVGSGETTQATSTGATQNSDYGTYFSFGSAFAGIPDDATITGVTLEARQWIGTTARGTVGWRLDSAAGTQIANEISGALSITAAPTAGTPGTGNSYSTWSALPTVAQLKSANFRSRVRFRRTASQATTYTLDWVRLTVTYSQNTEARVSFPRPSTGNLALGAGLQEFYARVRKDGTGSNPTCAIELLENGALVSTVLSATAVSSTTGVTLSGTWDASALSDRGGSEVEARIVGSGASGGVLEVGAVRWWAGTASAPTSPLVPAYAPIAPY